MSEHIGTAVEHVEAVVNIVLIYCHALAEMTYKMPEGDIGTEVVQ